jgi:hypothetical protein
MNSVEVNAITLEMSEDFIATPTRKWQFSMVDIVQMDLPNGILLIPHNTSSFLLPRFASLPHLYQFIGGITRLIEQIVEWGDASMDVHHVGDELRHGHFGLRLAGAVILGVVVAPLVVWR